MNGAGEGMHDEAFTQADSSAIARRIRNVLSGVAVDCACKGRIEAALDRFAEIESERMARRELGEARHQRQRIHALLQLLDDVDHVSTHEVDAGVFAELAHLFDDVAASAQAGALAMRRLCDVGASGRPDPDTDGA